MKFTFTNSFHNTTARTTARDWRLSQRQVRRLWSILCGDLDCRHCEYGGIHGEQKWRLKKIGGIFNEGAEIVNN
jgi:hypothetical protein